MHWWSMASTGQYEDIQDLRCQASCNKFTVRRHTVLYRLKTPSSFILASVRWAAKTPRNPSMAL